MPAFTWPASYSASVEVAPRVTRAAFGDGYEQRVAAGINTLQRKWTLRFVGYDTALAPIEAFLIARAGVESFDWTPPSGDAGKWVCRQWQRVHSGPQYGELTATFEQVFGE
ncbi:MAG: phage tail protein [Thermomonas hydrothermalis]|uniref:phage tail protein n=1 Tax=Thermomonas hydrothermalis TaxID=213588 RepID=UPI002355E7E2|nr:phage tail protein [Thermomonas hydrothermalis]MCL6620237.1 phage tail protein [Thermomonas hydrothermalis]